MTTKISMLAIDLAKGSFQVCAVTAYGACVDVYGPRLIATPDLVGFEFRNCGRISGFVERPDTSSPQAPMDFRVLSPQCSRGIGRRRAGPHIRFRKRWERPFHHPQPSCCNFSGATALLISLFGSLSRLQRRASDRILRSAQGQTK